MTITPVLEHVRGEASIPPAWQLRQVGNRLILTITGDWIAQSGLIPPFPPDQLTPAGQSRTLAFDVDGVGNWDSGLIAFLWDARRCATAAGICVDSKNVPESARKLLGLLPDREPDHAPARHPRVGLLPRFGSQILAVVAEFGTISILLGATVCGAARAPFGRSRLRAADLLSDLRNAGPSALLIVSVVNFLIGAILAFIGAAQLRKFAADSYVADLVGLAMVREMAAVMTAIVMAGRTGGAYAARIATMRGSEELDALAVIGIPVVDYIVLPAILALVVTMPLLYLYGCLIGLLGGLVVATAMLNVSPAGYLHQTFDAVPLSEFVFGFLKCMAFAALIGVTSCRMGLRAGRSSADVGSAATQAVVIGIVGIIALDALFAVFANAVGI
jgi:phospholipid/cholesterol/gamma-HCH transport system permease protein